MGKRGKSTFASLSFPLSLSLPDTSPTSLYFVLDIHQFLPRNASVSSDIPIAFIISSTFSSPQQQETKKHKKTSFPRTDSRRIVFCLVYTGVSFDRLGDVV
jgi:hypothetical protein